jgi:uncharacterized membrane protein YtjA (UPF0391 family)
MLTYAITFFIIALVSAVLGFGVISGATAYIAQVCFVIFVVLFVVALVRGPKAMV